MNGRTHFKRHEIPPGAFVNLTPLIDVLMQLILFLMVMGSWSRANQIQLDLPKSTSAVKAQEKETLTVSYQMQNGKPLITLNSKQMVSLEALSAAMKAAGAGVKKPAANVQIEKTVPYQDVVALMDVVRDSGYPKFSLLTMQATPPK